MIFKQQLIKFKIMAVFHLVLVFFVIPSIANAAIINCERNPVSGVVTCTQIPQVGDTLRVNWNGGAMGDCIFEVKVENVSDEGMGAIEVTGTITDVQGEAACKACGFEKGNQTTLQLLLLKACNPVDDVIACPFSYDGAGEFCWKTSDLDEYINSWNLEILEINGIDFTNMYVDDSYYPPKIENYYYVYYKGNFAWSHFEIEGCTVTEAPTTTPEITTTPTSPPSTPGPTPPPGP